VSFRPQSAQNVAEGKGAEEPEEQVLRRISCSRARFHGGEEQKKKKGGALWAGNKVIVEKVKKNGGNGPQVGES